MKKTVGFLVLLFVSTTLLAQFKVQFKLIEQSAIKHDTIYVAGTFNGWDSLSNRKYLMQPTGENEKSLTLELPAGPVAYKFHRGDWMKVEKEFNGREVFDRSIFINRDTVLVDTVDG
ncbi:MAG: glycogen-binding domain-containing protein, partial [Saprospiraceae bacterium]|nr:glycogen-binding domain-containing protein [Saprospiraceae bacterium]